MKIMSSMLRSSLSNHLVEIANNNIKLAIAPTTRKFIMIAKIAGSNSAFENELWFSNESIQSDIVLDVLIGLPAGPVGVGGRMEWNYVGRTTYTLNKMISILSSVLAEKTEESSLGGCSDPFSADFCDDGMTTSDLEMFRDVVLSL